MKEFKFLNPFLQEIYYLALYFKFKYKTNFMNSLKILIKYPDTYFYVKKYCEIKCQSQNLLQNTSIVNVPNDYRILIKIKDLKSKI